MQFLKIRENEGQENTIQHYKEITVNWELV